MGLDIVELVMEIEDEFQVRLPSVLPETVGELFDLVRSQIQRDSVINGSFCPSIPAFFEVRNAIHGAWNTSERIYPSTELAAILPGEQLFTAWERLESQLNVRLPSLRGPIEQGAAVLAVMGSLLALELFAWLSADFVGLLFATVVGIPVILFLSAAIMNRLPRRLPNHILSVGDLVRVVLPARGVLDDQSESLLWKRFVGIISDQLDVPVNLIHRSSHFVRDLKCD